MPVPSPSALDPVANQPRVQFLKPHVSSPLIDVGDYSYYDDPDGAEHFQERNVLYHYGPDRLRIGSFCAFATNVRFIMNGANHRMDGVTTFPFPIFGHDWGESFDLLTGLPNKGDTVVGNDVWIGYGATIAPGVRIGDGAIVAALSVVTKDVRPYAIAGGNPAVEIRRRFSDGDVERLLAIAWWNWPIDKITRHVRELMSGDVDTISRI